MHTSRILIIGLFVFLTACSDGPGPLEGTWELTGAIPITVIYRDGEEEAMGIISKVTYEHDGDDVLVTYTDGIAKGAILRVTMTGSDSAISGVGKLKRVR